MNRLGIIQIMALMFVFSAVQATAQKAERSDIRKGNGYYKKEKFTEAEIEYRKSIEVNPRSMEGIYNLGNTLYRQEKYPEAAEQYNLLAGQAQRILQENPKNVEKLSQVFHNLGNIGMRTKEYQKSVDAYKQALRFNPKDDETRYNLALAQKLLSDQQQQQQDQNQDQNKDEQNKDEQQQQDQKDQEQEQNQDQQQQPKEDQQQKTQEQQQPNEQMSRDNAQQMLDAFLQDEKDTQEKVKKIQMQQQQSRKREKQW